MELIIVFVAGIVAGWALLLSASKNKKKAGN